MFLDNLPSHTFFRLHGLKYICEFLLHLRRGNFCLVVPLVVEIISPDIDTGDVYHRARLGEAVHPRRDGAALQHRDEGLAEVDAIRPRQVVL